MTVLPHPLSAGFADIPRGYSENKDILKVWMPTLFPATKICLCAYEICACANTHTGVYCQHIFYQSSKYVSLGEL